MQKHKQLNPFFTARLSYAQDCDDALFASYCNAFVNSDRLGNLKDHFDGYNGKHLILSPVLKHLENRT